MPRIPTAKLASKGGAQRHNPLPQQLQEDQLTGKFGLVSAPGRRSKKSKAKPQSASDDEEDQKQYAAPQGMVTGGKAGGRGSAVIDLPKKQAAHRELPSSRQADTRAEWPLPRLLLALPPLSSRPVRGCALGNRCPSSSPHGAASRWCAIRWRPWPAPALRLSWW